MTVAGYKRTPRVYNLVFQGDFEGLNVQATGMPVGEFLELANLYEGAEKGNTDAVSAIFDVFARHLVAWNLEDENDQPVPPTVDGMKAQELDFVLAVISHWIEAISSVSRELGKASKTGGTSAEALLPMETL